MKETLPGVPGKVNQIRIYSGEKYDMVQEAQAGTVCALTGPEDTHPGQGIGCEEASEFPVLEPVLTYRIELPDGCDVHTMLRNLRQIEEEEPQLHVVWAEETSEIHIQLMGEVQTEVLQQMVKQRFGVLIGFGEGNIVYKETIKAPVEGVGHFEPLRHYAEVHLLLEPGRAGLRDAVLIGMRRGCPGQELAEADPDSPGGERAQGSPDRVIGDGHAYHAPDREGASETYRRRRFPAGDLPGGPPGAEEGRKHPAGTIL